MLSGYYKHGVIVNRAAPKASSTSDRFTPKVTGKSELSGSPVPPKAPVLAILGQNPAKTKIFAFPNRRRSKNYGQTMPEHIETTFLTQNSPDSVGQV
jgi:hypothetical protein